MAIKRKIVLDKKPVASIIETPRPIVPPPPAVATVTTIETGGKFRRLKDHGVAKVSRFERELCPSDRDTIIRWWNQNQRLVNDDDPACSTLTITINSTTQGLPLSPMQTAGYMSYLCRLGLWLEDDRRIRVARSIQRGSFTVTPVYSQALIEAIRRNWEQERADEQARAAAHAAMRAARARGERVRIRGTRTVVLEPAQTLVPVVQPEEEFDIKWM